MHLHAWLFLPVLVAATTTKTVTQTRGCSDGAGTSITAPPPCGTTDCASAGAAIPTCAQDCISSVANDLGCSDGDAICTCDNMPFIQTAAAPCVQSACSSEQYAPVTESVNGLCSCASALSSDQACIASESAAAGTRSRTRTTQRSSKSTSRAQTGEETSSTDIGSVSSDTAVQSATKSNSNSNSESLSHSESQSKSQTKSESKSQSQSNTQLSSQSESDSQSKSKSTAQGSSSTSATQTGKGQTSSTVTDSTSTSSTTTTVTTTVSNNNSSQTVSTDSSSASAASRTTIRVDGSRKAYAACPFTTIVQTASIPATASASGPTTYSYLGCYKDNLGDRAVTGLGYTADERGVDECGVYCFNKNATFFAVEYHGECFCGDDLNDVYGCDTTCNLDCWDEPTHLCGGDVVAQVYYLPDPI